MCACMGYVLYRAIVQALPCVCVWWPAGKITKIEVNSHSIRRSRFANCSAGVLDYLNNLPQINGMQVSIDIIL